MLVFENTKITPKICKFNDFFISDRSEGWIIALTPFELKFQFHLQMGKRRQRHPKFCRLC